MTITYEITNQHKFDKIVKYLCCDELDDGKVLLEKFGGEEELIDPDDKTVREKYGFIFKFKTNIFDLLDSKNICYAVGVNLVTFKSEGSGRCGREYFVVASRRDVDLINGLGLNFKKTRGFTLTRVMNDDDILHFKKIQDKFNKVIHETNGRIYEQKKCSFKKYQKAFS